jgi:hypothetical protein
MDHPQKWNSEDDGELVEMAQEEERKAVVYVVVDFPVHADCARHGVQQCVG